MANTASTPAVGELGAVVSALRQWQHDPVADAAPVQLHPGDVGWYWRHGTQATADAIRIWRRDGRVVAVGLLDGPDLGQRRTCR